MNSTEIGQPVIRQIRVKESWGLSLPDDSPLSVAELASNQSCVTFARAPSLMNLIWRWLWDSQHFAFLKKITKICDILLHLGLLVWYV